MATFSTALFQAIQAQGFTQAELAQACKMGQGRISNYASGKVSPRAETIELLSKALRVEFWCNGPEWGYVQIFNYQ